ncbi:MAG: hypothetical protein ACK5WO_04245 [Cyclobacteriaceae bacterium]|jgi:hypothetical protein|nr:hypothetical protein [Flammeovirgaceae bacterium]
MKTLRVVFAFFWLLAAGTSSAQSKLVLAGSSNVMGISLPTGSKRDSRLLSTAAAQTLLDMEAEDNNLKLSNDTEVLSLPPGAASEKWIWDEIAKNNWTVLALPTPSNYLLQRGQQRVLIYLKSASKETTFYLCSVQTAENPSPPSQVVEPPVNTPDQAAINPTSKGNSALTNSRFAFHTTNFDDGWVATAKDDWVEVTKSGIKILIHFHTKETSAYISDYREEDRLAWNTFIVPRYGSVSYTEGPSSIGFERPHLLLAQVREPESGLNKFVVLFKMGQSNWMEFIAPDQDTFIQAFGVNINQVDYYATTTFDPLRKMNGYNKFAVAPADLTGRWSSSFGGFTNYINVYTGATSTNTHSSAEWFAFREDGTYDWQLSTASGFVGNIKFDGAKSGGRFTMPNNWQINFSEIEKKPRLYNAYFTCERKGARILWLQDTSYGGFTGFGKE